MLKKVYKKFLGDELEIKERLFRIILLVGIVAVCLAIIQGLTLVNARILMGLYGVMLVSFAAACVLTFGFNKSKGASVLVGIVLVYIALPIVFFLGGGINSGAANWMCLGIFYMFIMFSGYTRVVFVLFTLLVYSACYVIAYIYPDLVVPLKGTEVYFDSWFAVTIVGVTVGTIIDFHIRVYEKERKKSVKQQEELERLSKSKDTFFANMSHEIRTPLNSVIGLNELILRENPSEEIAGYASNIQHAGKMLLSLVNDILDLSQLEVKRMQLVEQEYRTASLFHEVVDVMQVRMKEKNLNFMVEVDANLPSVLIGDEKRIKQIMMNLLTNAVKYTNEGSVTLICNFKEKEDGSLDLVISVADTGIGIRKEDLEHLFDAFTRFDNNKNYHIEGTGLGLSIIKQLLDLMGGTIMVDSIYTQGSLFTVTIPQKIANASAMGAFMEEHEKENVGAYYSKSFEAPEARVLIVDDDDLNLIITTKLLQETKMSIDTASSAEECLRKTQKRYYNLIFMDYMMSDMNGGETLAQIRKQENGLCKDTPVVLLSANVFGDKYAELLEKGFDGFLEKPLDAVKLEEEALKFIPDDLIEYRRAESIGGQAEGFVSRLLTRKRKKIYITTDSVSDLSPELAQEYDVKVIDLYIQTQYGRFRDVDEINVNNLVNYLTDEESLVSSLSAPVEEYEKFFAEALTEAEDIIYFAMNANAGKCYSNALEAAKGFSHVHVVDSGNISCAQAILVINAVRMAREGMSAEEIVNESIKYKNKIGGSFILKNTKILRQKRYTDFITSSICTLFNMHPVIGMYHGKVSVLGVRIGRLENVWRKYIRYHLRNKSRIDTSTVIIVYAGLSVQQQELILDEVRRCIKFDNIIFTQSSASNVCNCGMGAIGIGFMHK